jgi:hypothetical protein
VLGERDRGEKRKEMGEVLSDAFRVFGVPGGTTDFQVPCQTSR